MPIIDLTLHRRLFAMFFGLANGIHGVLKLHSCRGTRQRLENLEPVVNEPVCIRRDELCRDKASSRIARTVIDDLAAAQRRAAARGAAR